MIWYSDAIIAELRRYHLEWCSRMKGWSLEAKFEYRRVAYRLPYELVNGWGELTFLGRSLLDD